MKRILFAKTVKKTLVALASICLALALASCAGASGGTDTPDTHGDTDAQSSTDNPNSTNTPNDSGDVEIVDGGTTDQMWDTEVKDDEFYVFQIDGQTVMVCDYYYPVDVSAGEPLVDGGFYKVVADVTYLNGGIAGYVDYPEDMQVKSVEEVSPFDMGLPSLDEKQYGLLLVGDYADGDVLFRERNTMAVWKDGAWVYRFENEITLPDGRVAGVAEDVSEDDVQAGIDAGVLSCEDYFVMPLKQS